MDGTVSQHLMSEWLAECDAVQMPITETVRDALAVAGTEVEVLVDGIDEDTGELIGRTHREAPEIDGVVRLEGASARPGVVVRAKVTAAVGTDVIATPIEVVA